MPVTSIKTKDKEGQPLYLQFITETVNELLMSRVFKCREDYYPLGEPHISWHNTSEEQYHKDLRNEAFLKQEFVAQYSTNPEWNPVPQTEVNG